MDLLVELFARPIRWLLNFIGGTMRCIHGSLVRLLGLSKRPSFTYREYLNGPDRSDDVFFDRTAHRFNNVAIGTLTLILLLALLLFN